MMKKLLVLALVLAVAGLANAGLVNFVQGPAGFVVTGNIFDLKCTITGDTNIGLWSNGAAKMSDFAKGADVPATLDASGFFFNVSDLITLKANETDGQVWTLAAFGAAAYPFSGKMLSGVLAKGTTEVYVAEFDGDGAMVGDVVTYTIPEPMTMGLLALGGLFLRKK